MITLTITSSIDNSTRAKMDLNTLFSLMNRARRDKESWEDLARYIAESQGFSAEGLHTHLNIPKILWPGSTQFSFVDLKDWIKVISWANIKPINIISKSRAMIIRPQYFDAELKISPFEIFSKQHTDEDFKKIATKVVTLDSKYKISQIYNPPYTSELLMTIEAKSPHAQQGIQSTYSSSVSINTKTAENKLEAFILKNSANLINQAIQREITWLKKQQELDRKNDLTHFTRVAPAVWWAAPTTDMLQLKIDDKKDKTLIHHRITELYPVFIPYEPVSKFYFKKITAVDPSPKPNLPPRGVFKCLVETFLDVSSLYIFPPLKEKKTETQIPMPGGIQILTRIEQVEGEHEKRNILIESLVGENDISFTADALSHLGGTFNQDLKNAVANKKNLTLEKVIITCGGQEIPRAKKNAEKIYGIEATISFIYNNKAWKMKYELIDEALYTMMLDANKTFNDLIKAYKNKITKVWHFESKNINTHTTEFESLRKEIKTASEKSHLGFQQESIGTETKKPKGIKKSDNLKITFDILKATLLNLANRLKSK